MFARHLLRRARIIPARLGWPCWAAVLAVTLSCVNSRAIAAPAAANPVDYNRDIRPILAEHCYACHGPDENQRKAKLRLDRRDGALAVLRSGQVAVKPGDRLASGLFLRVTTSNERERMPPRNAGKALDPVQVELLGRWIDQGMPWDAHWAYVAPRSPSLAQVRDRSWPRNEIDFFVLKRLEEEGLRPSPPADRATLARRLGFDLTGLPPTPAEVDAAIQDTSADWYEHMVDRLLASPHYGERMAQQWLDLARYADTNGYRLDNHRDIWQYRDWVIAAFNANKPFDQFTIEQLTGDLLPGATRAQRIATGFHRNTMVNFGNGSDPREYLAKAVSDRAITTATVWLGTTMGCAQCHDHKYDPFTQKDFYRLYAFFNNVPEKGLDGDRGNPAPVLMAPSPKQAAQLAVLSAQKARLEKKLARALAKMTARSGYRIFVLCRDYLDLGWAEDKLRRDIPSTLVMEEMSRPRSTHLFPRGDFIEEGEEVTPGVPESLPPLPAGLPANRLGLAHWLIDPANPLTSRVAVNRYWHLFFGAGIVRTLDDFGSQGEMPSHPELLDWLASEFVRSGWDIKALHKKIVLSATYRQSSRWTDQLRERDPDNRLLARGPRFRLDAETIRDNALAISGLLHRAIGGPSVKPYQPPGLWEQVAVGGDFSSQTYQPSHGPDLYRRGLYTYWKRSLPPPSLVAFDAPTRELCTACRSRTNTPLQALVLLNDPTYVEAARALGQRVVRDGGPDTPSRIRYAFRLCAGRPPTDHETAVLLRVYRRQQAIFTRDRKAAEELIRVGESKVSVPVDPRELAAWTALGNLLLNLDETITKE